MKAVVVASGELAPRDERWLEWADLVIAADGGAAALTRHGRRPDVLVGDLDSVDAALVDDLAAAGTRVERHPADKEASDSELALGAAIAAGAGEIVLIGATGGPRLDHELANVLLLADPAFVGRQVRLIHGSTVVRAIAGGDRLELTGSEGDLVTLLPIGGDVAGVTTGGLRWPLAEATLTMGRSRGLSNQIDAPPASVSLERGTLLVVESSPERSTS